MTRYFFVILLMALIGIAIVVKAGITMFAERQYWQDVADRFVKENVTVKPNRGNIISSDGKLMASSLPEYRIYMDFMSGEKDEKRRKKRRRRRRKTRSISAANSHIPSSSRPSCCLKMWRRIRSPQKSNTGFCPLKSRK